jgi:hypothetical protein
LVVPGHLPPPLPEQLTHLVPVPRTTLPCVRQTVQRLPLLAPQNHLPKRVTQIIQPLDLRQSQRLLRVLLHQNLLV